MSRIVFYGSFEDSYFYDNIFYCNFFVFKMMDKILPVFK